MTFHLIIQDEKLLCLYLTELNGKPAISSLFVKKNVLNLYTTNYSIMISAHYVFHVYIMHHFRGEEILHRGLFKGYIIIS